MDLNIFVHLCLQNSNGSQLTNRHIGHDSVRHDVCANSLLTKSCSLLCNHYSVFGEQMQCPASIYKHVHTHFPCF